MTKKKTLKKAKDLEVGDVLNIGTGEAIILELKEEVKEKALTGAYIVLAFIRSKREFVTWIVSPSGVTFAGWYDQGLTSAWNSFCSR